MLVNGLWSVTLDVTIIIVLGCHQWHPCKCEFNWQNAVCVLTAPWTGCSPSFFLSSKPPCFLQHNNIEMMPVNNPAMVSQCLSEKKSHIPLILNQKLEMIRLAEEGTSKAKRGWKLGFLDQVVNAKDIFWRKLQVPQQGRHEWWGSETALLQVWRKF